jgi:hypothetical protein
MNADIFTSWRAVIAGLIIAMMFASWFRGERAVRRYRAAPTEAGLGALIIVVWRIVMVAATSLSIIAVAGLWVAQDASDEATAAAEASNLTADAAAELAGELCRQNLEWQGGALDIRDADVRIVDAELRIARRELLDADDALEEAEDIVYADDEVSVSEQFFLDRYERDLKRAESKITELTGERIQRVESQTELASIALTECPPED